MLYDLTVSMYPHTWNRGTGRVVHANDNASFVEVEYKPLEKYTLDVADVHPTYLQGRLGFEMRVVEEAKEQGVDLKAIKADTFDWCDTLWASRFRSLMTAVARV
jgi:hypothetical protein